MLPKATLVEMVKCANREAADRIVGAAGKPVCEADRSHPGFVVRVDLDGTRTRGRMQGKRFEAEVKTGA